MKNGPRLIQLFKALKVKTTEDLDEDIKNALRRRLGIAMVIQEETTLILNEAGENERRGTGNFRSRVARNGYFKLGEREIGLARDIGTGTAAARPKQEIAIV